MQGLIVAIILATILLLPTTTKGDWEPDLDKDNVHLMKKELYDIDMYRLVNQNDYPVCVSFQITEGYNYQEAIDTPITVPPLQTVDIGTVAWYSKKYPAEWAYQISVEKGPC